MGLLRRLAAALWLCIVLVAGGALAQSAGTAQVDTTPVDTALVLAIDASASVSSGFLDQQINGHAAAFRDPSVQQAVISLEGGIAVRVLLWSNRMAVPLPWVFIRTAADANQFAQQLLKIDRPSMGGTTAMGAALMTAGDLLAGRHFTSRKQVIDIVSNGFSNAGPDPMPVRDRLIGRGVTINGLAILDEESWLESYFTEYIIGGVASFVTSIDNQDDYVNALRRKLIQELS